MSSHSSECQEERDKGDDMKSANRLVRLQRRRDDYDRMTASGKDKNDYRGYHKPGSNKK